MKDIKRKLMIAGMTASSIGLLFLITVGTSPAQSNDAALIAKAKGIHDRVLKLDTHNDIEPANFTADCNYTMRLTTQVNLPKMVEGGMDVSFMIVYVGQGPLTPEGYDNAYRQAIAKFDAIHRLTEKIAPDNIGLALTPADVLALHKKNLRIAVIGVENGYPIGTDIKRVKEFYDRGGRYMSLAHNGNSQLADSNTGETQGYLYNNGLSPLGREVIAEMNRLGMMVDLSHPSKGANMEAMRLSQGSGDCVAFRGARAGRCQPEYGRRAVAGSQEERRRDSDRWGSHPIVKTDSKERIEALAKLREEFGLTSAGRRRTRRRRGRGDGARRIRPGYVP